VLPFARNFLAKGNFGTCNFAVLLSLCREIAGARDILQKFENLKNNTSEISTYDFAFLRRRSRKLNCRKNFTNISSMESIYIINILIVD
jgi:hypothetical protein